MSVSPYDDSWLLDAAPPVVVWPAFPKVCGPIVLDVTTHHIHVYLPGSSSCQCGENTYAPRASAYR